MGPTGKIKRSDFEKSIVFDEVLNYLMFGEYKTYHYFKDGSEVGYWSPFTKFGMVHKEPQKWLPHLKAKLTPVTD